MYNAILKKLTLVLLHVLLGGLATFGGSLFSGFIRSHKVSTLLSGGCYFRRVITFGTLQYIYLAAKNKKIS